MHDQASVFQSSPEGVALVSDSLERSQEMIANRCSLSKQLFNQGCRKVYEWSPVGGQNEPPSCVPKAITRRIKGFIARVALCPGQQPALTKPSEELLCRLVMPQKPFVFTAKKRSTVARQRCHKYFSAHSMVKEVR